MLSDLIIHFYFSGVTKPASVEQPILIVIILGFVQQFVPEFSAADLTWVRAMKSSKFGVLNCQCWTVMMASKVKSTFASLVKTKPTPAFIGKVCYNISYLSLFLIYKLTFVWMIKEFPSWSLLSHFIRCLSHMLNKSGLEFDCLSCGWFQSDRRIMIQTQFVQSQPFLLVHYFGKF